MRLWFLLLVGVAGVAILLRLGAWQVERLAWKQDLLGRIATEISADPIDLRSAVEPEFRRYAPVTISGQFGPDHIRMLASRRNTGAVHRIIRPFLDEEYGLILVDTGWLRASEPVPDAPQVRVTVTGNLDNPIEADQFTPAPDIAKNLWFARDVPAMARTLGTEPVMVVLRDAPGIDLGVTPWPVDTAGISNDHLQYAITWFSLALIWGAMTALFLLRTRRGPR